MPSVLQDYCNTGDTADKSVYDNSWLAQTFTAIASYSITSGKVYIKRVGLPGNVILSIRNTSDNPYPDWPTDADLISKTQNGNSFLTSKTWVEFIFGSPIILTKDTKYTIVLGVPSGNSANRIDWRTGSNLYAGGMRFGSNDSGVNWSWHPTADLLFETRGIILLKPKTLIIPECWNW